MALAALWVIPVSAAIVVGSYRVQDKVQARTMAAKMARADGTQYIETSDLKAGNAEQRYSSGLSDKIRAGKCRSITAELENSASVSASMVPAGYCVGGAHRSVSVGRAARRAGPCFCS